MSVTQAEGKPTKPKKQRLTPRQAKFAKEYVKTGVGAEAARNAGYMEASAKEQAHRLLTYAHVDEAVQAWRARLQERISISTEKVINDVAHIAERAAVAGDNKSALRANDMLAKHLGAYAPSVSVHVDASAAHLAALQRLSARRDPKLIENDE